MFLFAIKDNKIESHTLAHTHEPIFAQNENSNAICCRLLLLQFLKSFFSCFVLLLRLVFMLHFITISQHLRGSRKFIYTYMQSQVVLHWHHLVALHKKSGVNSVPAYIMCVVCTSFLYMTYNNTLLVHTGQVAATTFINCPELSHHVRCVQQ